MSISVLWVILAIHNFNYTLYAGDKQGDLFFLLLLLFIIFMILSLKMVFFYLDFLGPKYTWSNNVG